MFLPIKHGSPYSPGPRSTAKEGHVSNAVSIVKRLYHSKHGIFVHSSKDQEVSNAVSIGTPSCHHELWLPLALSLLSILSLVEEGLSHCPAFSSSVDLGPHEGHSIANHFVSCHWIRPGRHSTGKAGALQCASRARGHSIGIPPLAFGAGSIRVDNEGSEMFFVRTKTTFTLLLLVGDKQLYNTTFILRQKHFVWLSTHAFHSLGWPGLAPLTFPSLPNSQDQVITI